jgi:hypothetical protein
MIASEQAQSSDFVLMALFARMDNVAMAAAMSLLFVVGLPTATVVLLLLGAPPGVPIGPNLSALGNILPGYSVTWLGSLIGAFWGAVIGAVVGFLMATFWNFSHVVFTGLSALSYQRHFPSRTRHLQPATLPKTTSKQTQLLSAVTRLNVWISALGVGLASGLTLYVATNLTILLSHRPGRYLNLLAVFMPGYSASASGAWMGLLWGTIYGAVSGGTLAWLYARTLGARVQQLVMWDNTSVRQLRPPVLRISSHALGIGLGVVAALQLSFATLWLVLRGTADESFHAKLLANYLPGYTVSWSGSLLGGVESFLLVYLSSALVGETYNAVIRHRHKAEAYTLP